MIENKGTIGTIITLIVGLGIAVLTIIFLGTLSGNVYEKSEANINEIGDRTLNTTVTLINGTAVSVGVFDIHFGTINVTNVTTHRNMELVNFTIDYGVGTITLNSELPNNNSNYYVQATYGNTTIMNSIKGGIISGFESYEDTASYIPIIVLAVIIAMVLALVMGIGGGIGKGPGQAL